MVIRLRVSTGNLRAYVRITGVDKTDVLSVMREVQELWELNISRFFKRHKMYHPLSGNRLRKYKPISEAFYCSIVNGVIIGSIDTVESPHIKNLIYGVPPGEGAFVPPLGVRMKKGYFRGVPTIYWKQWEAFFRAGLRIILSKFHSPRRQTRRRRANVNEVRAAAVGHVRLQVSRMGVT